MSKRILISLLFLLLLFPHPMFAQTNKATSQQPVMKILRVAPAINNLQLIPGQTTSYIMDIDNLLSEPLGIRISVENFSPSDEDNGITTNTSAQSSPLITWVKPSDESIIMPQHGSKSITITITTPNSVKDGGYYGIISLTPFYISHPAPNAPIILSKIGTLVFGTVGNLDYKSLVNKVYIRSFSLPMINENNQIPLILRVQNSYFTHFSGKPFITITPLFGTPQTIELEDKHILPNTTRRWMENIKINQPWHIFYKTHVAFSVGAGNELFADTFFFILPLKEIIIAAIIVFLLIGGLLLKKRIKKAFTILINKD